MEEESNEVLVFLDTLSKQNNRNISVVVYTNPTHTDQYLHYSSHHQVSCKESVVSTLFNRAYSCITNEDDLTKENARIKQVLLVKSLKELVNPLKELVTITACLSYNNKRKPQMSNRKGSELV